MILGAILAALTIVAAFRPGTSIIVQDTPPPRSSPTDTGVWFVAGITEKGPLVPTLIQSLSDYARLFGDRVSYGTLYDSIEGYFHEGGAKAYISRVVGAAAVAAFHVFNDAGAAATLRAEANSVGEWGNALNVAILAPDVAGFKIQVSHDTDGILETSPDLADKAAAFAWAAGSDYITLVDQASVNIPAVVAAQNLAGGTDDRASIVDADWQTSLDRFVPDLGPGQVSFPGRTTDTAHTALLAHAAADENRVAVIDLPDSADVATLQASSVAARVNGSYGGGFAPWLIGPGLTAGTTRTIAPSALIAALCSRNDGAGLSPNIPAAGDRGEARWFTGLSQDGWTAQQRQDLNDSGVNVIRSMFGGVRVYGWRTLVDPVATPNWISLGNARLRMAIKAACDAAMEGFVFDQIDGRGTVQSDLKGALAGELLKFYNEGSLYGNTPDEAFNIDTGPQVNTPQTLAALELHAVVAYRDSPFAEFVQLILVKRPITEAVS